jgi:hypothetical protein
MKKLLPILTFILLSSFSAYSETKIVDPFDPKTGFGAKEVGGGKINELLKNGWKVISVTNRGDSFAPVYHLTKKNELIYCAVASTTVKCFKP